MSYTDYEYEILADIEAEVRRNSRFELIEFQSRKNGLVRLIHHKSAERCYWINGREWFRNADIVAADLRNEGFTQYELGDDFVRRILTYGYVI